MQRHENWMSFSYGGIEYGNKRFTNDTININFNKKIHATMTYRDALLNNARVMRDSYKEPFDVCLSGGTDSEIMVRAFKEVGITHNTFIFRMEDNHNVRDVTAAVELCKSLNIPYKLIDFNLKEFFEKDALPLLEKTYLTMAGRLPRLKFLDYLDNIPVFGDGEPYWKREYETDYTRKSPWHFYLHEDGYAVSIYSRMIDRVVIGDWYEFTPHVMMSYKNHMPIRNLLDDKIAGKTSTMTSRVPVHQAFWPDMTFKPKLVGYEGANLPQLSRPDFMNEFYAKYMADSVDQVFWYTEQELDRLVLV